MGILVADWEGLRDIGLYTFVCGYCGATTGVRVGYREAHDAHRIYICGGCNRPTFIEGVPTFRRQTPAQIFGDAVAHLPKNVEDLYNQARSCTQVEAYTGCVLICRKILMHVAVENGAAPNQNFFTYVEYLAANGYIPPNGRGWVDHIRIKGNEATHEIFISSREDAQELLSFVEMLLRFVFEFPARIMPAVAK